MMPKMWCDDYLSQEREEELGRVHGPFYEDAPKKIVGAKSNDEA